MGDVIRTAVAVLVRPWLWRSALRFVPTRWWTYPPYLPMPPKEYREFRMETMYGDKNHPFVAEDTVRFLNWCRRMEQIR